MKLSAALRVGIAIRLEVHTLLLNLYLGYTCNDLSVLTERVAAKIFSELYTINKVIVI